MYASELIALMTKCKKLKEFIAKLNKLQNIINSFLLFKKKFCKLTTKLF
jgi:hypothetical protein